MTRFARAKGSKASNERQPEEATSWSEMKKSLLSSRKEGVENQTQECTAKGDDGRKHSEWASLGDDGCSETLLKQPVTKQNTRGGKLEEKGKVKKKKEVLDANGRSGFVSGKPKKGNKKREMSVLDESESKVKKKKVQETNDESEFVNGKSKKGNKKGQMSAEESKGKVEKKKVLETIDEGEFVNGKPKKGNKKREMSALDESESRMKKKKKKKVADDFEEAPPKKKKKVDEVEVKNKKKFKGKQTDKKFKSGKVQKKFKGNSNENGKTQFQGEFSVRPKGTNTKKGSSGVEELIINGEKIEIVKFQGFFVTLEDAERLKKLRSEMQKEGIPRDKLEAAIKLERRRAEKALSRLKKSVCFHCRGHGHLLSNCPDLVEKETTGVGICYKCGSTEHSAAECRVVRSSSYQFAECFICKEQGHIARQCPDNPRGLYPQGGACRECGDVTHLRKDCPKVLSKKEEEAVTVGLRNDRDLECLDEEIARRMERKRNSAKAVKKNSTVKF